MPASRLNLVLGDVGPLRLAGLGDASDRRREANTAPWTSAVL
jgi:hypothetical protein